MSRLSLPKIYMCLKYRFTIQSYTITISPSFYNKRPLYDLTHGPPTIYRGGAERMGPRPPPWVPLLKSYGSSILSTSLGSKTLNNPSSLGLGGTKTFLMYLVSSGFSFKATSSIVSVPNHLTSSSTQFSQE